VLSSLKAHGTQQKHWSATQPAARRYSNYTELDKCESDCLSKFGCPKSLRCDQETSLFALNLYFFFLLQSSPNSHSKTPSTTQHEHHISITYNQRSSAMPASNHLVESALRGQKSDHRAFSSRCTALPHSGSQDPWCSTPQNLAQKNFTSGSSNPLHSIVMLSSKYVLNPSRLSF